jgi:hypothetical protein
MDINTESFELIRGALEIPDSDQAQMDEEQMIIQIERRVAELIEQDFGLLMSYLYRLDVLEPHINACLNPKNPVHPYTCLAHLIWNRQKMRMKTKLEYKQDIEVEDGWEW